MPPKPSTRKRADSHSDSKPPTRKKVKTEIESDDKAQAKQESKSDKGKAKSKSDSLPDDPLPERVQSTHLLGAHISAAGGVENSVTNALKIGANAFSLFIRPKMSWASKPLSPESISTFQSRMTTNNYKSNQIIPHGMYLTNLANPSLEKRSKSIEILIDEMERCKILGIGLLNFHPGSSVGECSKEEALKNVSDSINEILVSEKTKNVTLVIENMAGAGNSVGGPFEELKGILDGVDEKFKDRIGVCLDTCHSFAYGYDFRTRESYEGVMKNFQETVGLKYLKAVHLNDSKEGLSSHKDRHANIGRGNLGLQAFYFIMNDQRFSGIPLILETPGGDDDSMYQVWKREIQALYKLQGLPEDPESWSEVWEILDEALRIKEQGIKRKDGKKEKTKANKVAKRKKEKAKKEEDQEIEVEAQDDDGDDANEVEEKNPVKTKPKAKSKKGSKVKDDVEEDEDEEIEKAEEEEKVEGSKGKGKTRASTRGKGKGKKVKDEVEEE